MTDKTLSIFVAASYKIACDHGFHDEELSDDHWLCLIVSEIMEAVNADRKGKRAQRAMFEAQAFTPQPVGRVKEHWAFCYETFIKDSVEDEMADVLITQDISPLWDETQVFVGQVKPHRSRFGTVERVLPQLCFINVPMMQEHGVTYYNPQKMFAFSHRRPDNAYDTGAWFLEDCRNHALPYREIDINQYCIHLGHASWKKKDAQAWLDEHKDLWHG